MLAAAYAPVITPGDPEKNTAPILAAMAEAHGKGCGLLVLPELCLTGCSCGDLFWQQLLLDAAERALVQVVEGSAALSGLTTVLGLPLRQDGALYSCAAIIREGALLGVVPLKSGDMRWFAPPSREGGQLCLPGMEPVAFAAKLIVRCGEIAVSMDYGSDVLAIPALYEADAASVERLQDMAAGVSSRGFACVLACPGRGESTTDHVYTGCAVVAANGEVLAAAEGEMVFGEVGAADWQRRTPPRRKPVLNARSPFFPYDEADTLRRCERIFALQVQGLSSRMERIGCRKLVLGVSGGLDSTLALLVAAKALETLGLPAENLLAVTMPGFGTTSRTRSNAETMAVCLGAQFREIPIGESVALHFRDIGHDSSVHNAVYENAQARERTQVLMDLANGCGGIVVGTGDMSELALGWCTYNGDQMSMYAVNAGVPKTAVRRVVEWYAAGCADGELRAALEDVLATPVSPELLPPDGESIAQVTEDLVGPYELHDFFLCRFMALGERPSALLAAAVEAFRDDYDAQTVEKWLRVFIRRFFTQQFKRSSAPDGPSVLGLSLSPRCGWRMSSDISPRLWLEELDSKK